jgi:hypothetical protein
MFTGDTFEKLAAKESAQKPKAELNAPPKIQIGLTKEDEIRIGLEMIPMFQAKESELTS